MKSQRCKNMLLGIIILAVLICALPVYAVDRYWIGADGAWNDSTMWNPAGQPQNGDRVYIHLGGSDIITRTVQYYNTLYPWAVLDSLSLRSLGNTSLDFVMSYSHKLYTKGTDVIESANFIQNNGTHTVTGALGINGSVASGGYSLNGGELFTGSTSIGSNGKGIFTQGGGVHTVGGNLSVQSGMSGEAEYNMNDGSLVVGGSVAISEGAKGTFTQAGGMVKAGSIRVGGFEGDGTYSITNGKVTAKDITSMDKFRQIGGVVASEVLNVKGNPLKDAQLGSVYSLGDGLLDAWVANIGMSDSKATLSQAGGNAVISLSLNIAGQNALYETRGGTLTANTVNIGTAVPGGTFSQAGGNVDIGTLTIGPKGVYTVVSKFTPSAFAAANIYNNGTFSYSNDLDNVSFKNTNQIINNGTFTMSRSFDETIIGGNVTNNGSFQLDRAKVTFNGRFTNNGEFRKGGETVIFNDTVQNNGRFSIGWYPAYSNKNFYNDGELSLMDTTMIMKSLYIGPQGYLYTVPNSLNGLVIEGDLINRSTQNTKWRTITNEPGRYGFARLEFQGPVVHKFFLTGSDLGAVSTGYLDNFAWTTLNMVSGTLDLMDGNAAFGGALYVQELLGASISGDDILNIFGNGLNIYYLANDPDNAYLAGLSYDLMNGGHLMPIMIVNPEPGTILLFALGVAGLLGAGWIKTRKRYQKEIERKA